MHPARVNRSVLALSGALLLACLGFAWVVGQPSLTSTPAVAEAPPATATSINGAELFQTRCQRCHSLEEAQSPLRESGKTADNRDAYIALLQRHRKSAVDEHEAITDYLLGELDRAADR